MAGPGRWEYSNFPNPQPYVAQAWFVGWGGRYISVEEKFHVSNKTSFHTSDTYAPVGSPADTPTRLLYCRLRWGPASCDFAERSLKSRSL